MIILLSGKAGSGKDFLAKHLCDNYGYTRVAFADELKKEVSEVYNIPLEELHDRDTKEKHRPLLIDYATKKRSEDADYFVNKIKIYRKTVITDCRFENERKKFSGGISIWINRDGLEDIQDNTQIKPEDCDFIINNNSTIEDLLKQIPISFGTPRNRYKHPFYSL